MVISVIDNGIGIKSKDRIKLFKLFGIVSDTNHMNTQGIGLGLVITENIVKAFGSVISVKSKWGKGTRFAFGIVLGKDQGDEGDEFDMKMMDMKPASKE